VSEVRVDLLGPQEWARFRRVRQEALRTDPSAFAASAHRWLDEQDHENAWRSRLEQVRTAVVSVDGDDVGTAGLSDEGELLAMWVAPRARGAGLGRALIDAVVALAADPARVHLRVMAGNSAGIAFYERCGFELEDTRPDAEQCLDMRRAARPLRP
jgi:ribosomal protein S18 acetylase RimI-like enzyme